MAMLCHGLNHPARVRPIVRRIPLGAAWLLAVFLLHPALPATSAQDGALPRLETIDDVEYHILRVDPARVRIVWQDTEGNFLRTFPAAKRFLLSRGESPIILMNGGIFEPDGSPTGLLVQNGRQLRRINRRSGKGNFYLEPNGVFLIAAETAAVVATSEYPLRGLEVREAVQSGPLLVRHGKIHPRFRAQSTSRLHRNGVGIDRDGKIVFAMTDFRSPKHPNLYEFAQLFRHLGCEDALFLDGDLCQMRSGSDLDRASNGFGSIIAIIARGGQEPASGTP